MSVQEILAHRLTAQHLIGAPFGSIEEVVRAFGAVQAQDYYGAKWAVGQRCSADDAAIEKAFNSGRILRTHVLRPTWHFVLPEDIRWMLSLTAPRVQRFNAYMYRKLELDEKTLKRGDEVLARALEGGKQLDRRALEAALNRARTRTEENRLVHFLMHAELEQVICSGARSGKQFTYALLSDRAPKARTMDRDEALAELVRRYFTTRGPANLADFAWWSGLTIADGKKGIAMAQREFTKVTINGTDHWYPKEQTPLKIPPNVVHLLPNYDEYGIGYKDRSAFYDPTEVDLGGGRSDPIFRHLLVSNGRLAGMWNNTNSKRTISVNLTPLKPMTKSLRSAISVAVKRYETFTGLPVELSDQRA